MRLEKRILQLEKQVLLLKAKIKANDLWKQEIQSWIYKTFKRSIVEKLIASDSGEDSCSENDSSDDAGRGSDMDVGYFPVSKKSRRLTKSPMGGRRRKHRSETALATNTIRNNPRIFTERCSEEDSVDVAISKARTTSGSDSSPPGLTKPMVDKSRNLHDTKVKRSEQETGTSMMMQDTTSSNVEEIGGSNTAELRSESAVFDEVELDDVTVDIVTTEDSPDSSRGEHSQTTEDSQSSTKAVTLKQSPTGGKVKGLIEIRADLKKYFEYWPNPNKPGEYKLACLIEGCNSKLSMHPSNRWANSARHLGGAHQIREYMPASFLVSAQGSSK